MSRAARNRRFRLPRPLLLVIALCLPAPALAQAPAEFEPFAAETELDELGRELDAGETDTSSLNTARNRASTIASRAKTCVTEATAARQRLETRYEPLKDVDPEVPPNVLSQRREIRDLLDTAITRQTQCGAVVDEAEALVERITATQTRLSQQFLFHRVEPAPAMLRQLPARVAALPAKVRGAIDVDLGPSVTPLAMLWLLLGAGLVAVALGLYLKHRFTRWFEAGGGHQAAPQLKYLFPKPLAEYSALMLEGLALTAVLLYGIRDASLDLVVVRVALGIFLYGFGCTVIDWATGPISPSANIKGLIPDHVAPLRRRLRFFMLTLVASFVVLGTNWLSIRLVDPSVGGRAAMILLVAVSLLVVLLYLGRIPGLRHRFRLVRHAGTLTLLGGIALLLLGYQNLAGYLIHGATRTALALLVLWILLWALYQLFDFLMTQESGSASRLRRSLGVPKDGSRSGLGVLQLIADLVLWISFVVYLIYVWDESGTTLDSLLDLIRDGTEIGKMRVVPIEVIGAILLFAGLIIVIGWIKRWVDRRWLMHIVGDRGAREAVTTLIGYIGFAIAFLIGLVAAGVDLGGLALVATALAFGVGLGMQAIAANFVSGIILLFERPLKAGDFVTVGNIEGFVRRIRLRATDIETLDNQNVLVPNSELVTGRVTNWVFRDPQGRLLVHVRVSYGSDVQKVREILERVASEHNEVITDGRAPAPRALLMEFGDSSLKFELRVRLQRIERRFSVLSDLNFAIDAAFRAGGIRIPYPQHDLHIVSYPDTRRQAEPPADYARVDTLRTRIPPHPEQVTRSHREDVSLDAGIDEVWAALTDIERLKSWLVRDGEFRPFIGGPFALTLRDDTELAGRIDIFLPPRRMRLVEEPREGEEPLASGPITIDLLLKAAENRTELSVMVSGIPASEDWQREYSRSEDRWHDALQELREQLGQK